MMADRAAWTRYAGDPGPVAPRSKYGAQVQEVGGIRFASRKEARRYQDLRLLERAGVISDLELQPRWPITVVGLQYRNWGEVLTVGHYTADFQYYERDRGVVIEDVKSSATRTTAYRLRKRLVEAIHGIRITEV
jgi:hypothetical protein